MARTWIVVGDATTGGGVVVTGSAFTDIDGKSVARITDKATCPLHKGVFSIVTGDATLIVDGQPVARNNDSLACGCKLIAGQQVRAFVEAGASAATSAQASSTALDGIKEAPGSAESATGATGSGAPAANAAPAPLACPTKVEFKENGAEYGFDDHTNATVPWKSVEKDKTDTVTAVLTPAANHAGVSFTSSAEAKVTISPQAPTSGSQEITVKGVAKGESEIVAECGGSARGKFKVKTYVKKQRTVAVRLVHSKAKAGTSYAGYTSTDISDAAITDALKKVYKQAVVEFKLTRLPEMTVDFDIDGDGKVDVESWMSAEMIKIRDACKDDSYDFNIFLVDNPSDDSTGFMNYNQRYGFVHASGSLNAGITFAHELGHGQGLEHSSSTDVDNVMFPMSSATKWRLRKDQWDSLNP